jgi:hypothetical protein
LIYEQKDGRILNDYKTITGESLSQSRRDY